MANDRDIRSLGKRLQVGIGQSIKKKEMKALGELAIELIVDRTRNKPQNSVPKIGARPRKMKPLAALTITERRKAIRAKKKSKRLNTALTSPERSNLTWTGQMLDSMRVKEATNKKVRWGPNRRRRVGGITNEQLAKIQEKKRPFNKLSQGELTKVAKELEKFLQKNLRRV